MHDTKSCTIWFTDHRKTHSKCSKWLPRVSLLRSHRRRKDWRILLKIHGGVLILSAITSILATRSSAEFTGVSYTKDFKSVQKKKVQWVEVRWARSEEAKPRVRHDRSIVRDMWHSRSAGPNWKRKVCWGFIVHKQHVSLDGEQKSLQKTRKHFYKKIRYVEPVKRSGKI